MSIVELILLLFALSGWTFLFNHATIMDKIGLRQFWQKSQFFKELFNCAACSGFQFGWTYGLFCILSLFFLPLIVFYFLTVPFAAMSFCFLWDRIVIFLDNKIIEQEKNS